MRQERGRESKRGMGETEEEKVRQIICLFTTCLLLNYFIFECFF